MLIGGCSSNSSKPSQPSNPEMVNQKIQLGKSYIQNGNFERAKFHLRDALEMAPESAEVYDALALLFMATGEEVLAEEYFLKALEKSPKNSRYRNNVASFLMAKGQYAPARDHFAIVVEDMLYENRTDAMVSLAICQRELGNETESKTLLNKVLKFNRLHPTALFLTSQQFLKEQKINDAFNYWQRLNMSAAESAASLYLGVQIAAAQGRSNDAASLAVRLGSLFPASREYLEYKQKYQ